MTGFQRDRVAEVKSAKNLAHCIDFAARVISSGRPTTRRFDSCFEWHGASAVAIALWRRSQKRPNTKLAKNLYNYIGEAAVKNDLQKYGDFENLETLCDYLAEIRKRGGSS